MQHPALTPWGPINALGTLYRWRDEFLAGDKAALSGKKAADTDQTARMLTKEIEERDRVIGELTIANRILKKIQDGSY
jgi:transposase